MASQHRRHINHRSAGKPHDFTVKIASLSEDALNKFDDAVEAVQDQASNVTHTIEDYMQKKPLTSLGIAALAGALLAIFIRK
jgi:ElaB/YqjD/DUF883 family membrane-anchored ribosome-binding protein